MSDGLPPPPPGYAQRMPRFAEASHLVSAGLDQGGRDVQLSVEAAAAWQAMKTASDHAGLHLYLLSGFRSVARQADIVRRKLAAGQTLATILEVSAYPGHSEHHTGRAIDVGSPGSEPLGEDFERTPEFAWLTRHADRFGFRLSYPRANAHGITYEPWHWCWQSYDPVDRPSDGD